MMSFTYEQKLNFSYDTTRAVPITEVVESLLALEKLLHESPRIINALVPEFDVLQVEVLLERIERGSLIEDLIVKICFKDQEGLDRWCEEVRKTLRIDDMQGKNPLLGPAVALLIAGGGLFAINKMYGKDAPHDNIEQHNSVLLQNCAIQFNVPEQVVGEVFEAVQNKTNVASNVCKILRPLRGEEGGSLIIGGYKDNCIDQGMVNEIPLKVSRDDAQSGSETLTNQLAVVRAMDLDHRGKGWAAEFPDVQEKRVKIKISPAIEPRHLLRSDGVMVDVTLDYKFNADGDKVYKRGYIERIVPPAE